MKRTDLASGFSLPAIPKRTPVPIETATQFTEAEEPSRVRLQRSKFRRDEVGERLVAYVPPELATELRVRCARERRSISDAVTAAVQLWAQSAKST